MIPIISVFSELIGSSDSAKVVTLHAEYLTRLKESKSNLITKKLGFGLNFMPPGVPEAEIGRFRSYPACKNDFFTLFSTVFALLLH